MDLAVVYPFRGCSADHVGYLVDIDAHFIADKRGSQSRPVKDVEPYGSPAPSHIYVPFSINGINPEACGLRDPIDLDKIILLPKLGLSKE